MSYKNILIDDLPTKINVNEKIFDINYDYRTAIRIIMAFEDSNLFVEEKIAITLKLLYKNKIPDEDIEEAYKKAILFLNTGKESKENKLEKRIYSFSKDANYILTGINSTHHIDILEHTEMHWWKFMALFMDMGKDCTFSDLIYYRKRRIEGKLTKEEKEQYKKIKEIVELDEIPTIESTKIKEAREKILQELKR